MDKASIIKILALVGALFTGGGTVYAGDVVTGLGIISAALSSASIFKTA